MWVNLSGFFSKLTVASGFTLELEEAVLNLLTYANEMENKEVLTFFRLKNISVLSFAAGRESGWHWRASGAQDLLSILGIVALRAC